MAVRAGDAKLARSLVVKGLCDIAGKIYKDSGKSRL